MKKINEIGNRYGRWLVIQEAEKSRNGHVRWKCHCECGQESEVSGSDLRGRNSRSCGCLAQELRREAKPSLTHGLSYHPLYKTWSGIKNRCYNPNYKGYKDYGGRGIKIYALWLKQADSFISWIEQNIGPRPSGHSLDRINNDGNYEPGNLRWADSKEQYHNRRIRLVTEQGGGKSCKVPRKKAKDLAFL